jgi:hypothetical protein
MADGRIERWARRLAKSNVDIVSGRRTPADRRPESRSGAETMFEGAAVMLAAPVTRRRAVALMGGAALVGSLLRPGKAKAGCWPGGPKVCTSSGGARVCVGNELDCCSNDFCAIACPYPWRRCEGPGVCQDTALMCSTPTAPGYDRSKTQFCSQNILVTGSTTCGQPPDVFRRRGWCCKPNETCGPEFGECTCPSAQRCSDVCCKPDQECVSQGVFSSSLCMTKCPPGQHHERLDCVCDTGQRCGLRCCPAGSVCSGSRCDKAKEPDRWPNPFDAFKNFFDTANQSAAGHGGRKVLAMGAGADEPAVTAALLALAAVNAQGIAAGTALSAPPADRNHRRTARPVRPRLPRVAPGPGLNAAAATALNQLLTAEARAFALVHACARSLGRARGASARRDVRTMRRQTQTAARYAAQAARALRGLPRLRARAAAALRSGGTAEVMTTATDIAALQASVQATGVPADLRTLLSRLGVSGADLEPVRAALLVSTPGGPALIGPLADRRRDANLRALASALGRFSASVRRSPVTRVRGGPLRTRQRVAVEPS